MKRFDYLTPVGFILGIFILVLGVVSGAGLSGFYSFIDLTSFFIVTGGLCAAVFISFSPKDLKRAPAVLKQVFISEEDDVRDLVKTFVSLSEQARKQGILSLDANINEMKDPFLKKGLLLAIDGWDEETIRNVMISEIAAMEERHRKGRRIFEKAGEFAPAWGMIGTLVGLVMMLKNLNKPETLGPNMAIALLTTLYGSLLANMLFIPIAAKLEEKTENEIFKKQVMIEGIIGIQSGRNPRNLESQLVVFSSKEEWAKKRADHIKQKDRAHEA
ncbi:flagellar motor protein MotP [Bacillus haynesii]|uniref:flagellar motor protein MotP n=1 Tax=Bacillus haynesii TaxID=1925021 RepID=UPI001C241590|nr:flagellar motor protein MotP [Bacillus haynesii]MBU8684725.1 flagellar motor protein MotP [Bacillus haynesii]MCY8435222.1 flagellar motor protein MotP [Bacillus haynesii]MCY8640734.1 flagellar motor protein MotP [Bacillus haynesii]MCY8667576.1 flagellar motor protein MotP [Bacillus haynesii]MCY9158258.1 flagellar motor protein MotP [Bacillus haynesii]